ncbi:UbiA prenyltransferase family protein [Hyunsoonleella pacifica]|uniref:Prenyltransferase n=1 Tax=Hyunsoonleella pacifica TaxID=1080224 RepID=A0A4Q9FIT5_9FLAO|nr:hypothetical protein [Hyunsoonleella pacifica]TBN12463.1 hypothetical protein EYD46_17240 [Hyunsoonleella pacifica]
MKVLKQLFNFYINSSIHVAIAVYALTYVTLLEFNLYYDIDVLYFVFYATITGYNFVKYFGLAKFHHRSLAGWLKAIQIFSFFCFLLMVYYTLNLRLEIMIYLSAFGLITFFYAIPFLPKRFFIDKNHNLRSIGGLKVYVIALVWSGVTVFLPLLNSVYEINTDVYVTGIQRFCFVILLILPFEIRDLKFDSLRLSTIPQRIGVRYTKIIGTIMALFIFILEFFKDDISKTKVLVLALVQLITVLFLIFAQKNQNKYYSSFWVESIPVLWLFILLVLR